MKVIMTYKNYHGLSKREILPEIFHIREGENPQDVLRKMWEADYNGAINDNLLNDYNDPIDEESSWFEGDMALITWADGDTKEFYVIDTQQTENNCKYIPLTHDEVECFKSYIADGDMKVAFGNTDWRHIYSKIVD